MSDQIKVAGARLREARERRGLSLRAVAKMTGLSASRVGQVERAEGRPPVETIERIANALGLRLAVVVSPVDAVNEPLAERMRAAVLALHPNDPLLLTLSAIAESIEGRRDQAQGWRPA